MAYHPLTNDTGQTPERRVEEAQRIVGLLADSTEQMLPHERAFVESMGESDLCTPKQLFLLRDLKEKYL